MGICWRKFIPVYCDIGLLGRSNPTLGVSPLPPTPLFSCIPNIFPVNSQYIIKDSGKIPILITFYKLFLSDIKAKILIIFWYFLMNFWIRWLTPSDISKLKLVSWCIWASFNDIESSGFKFQMFFLQPKLSFLACFQWFLVRTLQNPVNFVWNFDQWWHTRWCIRYTTAFMEV